MATRRTMLAGTMATGAAVATGAHAKGVRAKTGRAYRRIGSQSDRFDGDRAHNVGNGNNSASLQGCQNPSSTLQRASWIR